MSERLVIVGASARAAAFSAKRAGFAPATADLFCDVDLQNCCTAARLADLPRELAGFFSAQGSAPWMYTGSLENHPALVDQIAAGQTLYGNAGKVLRRVRDPGELATALDDAGLPFPEVRTSVDGLSANGTWLRKAYHSSAGLGVEVFGDGAIRQERRVAGGRRRHFYQRRAMGEPCGAVYVAAAGQARLLGVTRQLLGSKWGGSGEFCYAGSIGPLPVGDHVARTLQRIGAALAERFDLVGLFGVDVVVEGDTTWTIEVNPRYTASIEILERSLTIDAVGAHVAACRDGQLREPSPGGSGRPCGKAILYARHEHVVNAESVRQGVAENAGAAWPLVADIPISGTTIKRGEPILTVFSEGDDLVDVERRLSERLGRFERAVTEIGHG